MNPTDINNFHSLLNENFVGHIGNNFVSSTIYLPITDDVNYSFESQYPDDFELVELTYKNNTLADINKKTEDFIDAQITAYPCSVKDLDHMIYNTNPTELSKQLINLFENNNGWKVNGWIGTTRPVTVGLVNDKLTIELGKSSDKASLNNLAGF